MRYTPPKTSGVLYSNEPYAYDSNGTWYPGGPGPAYAPQSSSSYQNISHGGHVIQHENYGMSPGIGHLDSQINQVERYLSAYMCVKIDDLCLSLDSFTCITTHELI